jgi:hypothetical protein
LSLLHDRAGPESSSGPSFELEQLLAPIKGAEARPTTHAMRLDHSNKLIVGRSLLDVRPDFMHWQARARLACVSRVLRERTASPGTLREW